MMTVGELNRSLENLCSYVIESNGKWGVLSIRQQYLISVGNRNDVGFAAGVAANSPDYF